MRPREIPTRHHRHAHGYFGAMTLPGDTAPSQQTMDSSRLIVVDMILVGDKRYTYVPVNDIDTWAWSILGNGIDPHLLRL